MNEDWEHINITILSRGKFKKKDTLEKIRRIQRLAQYNIKAVMVIGEIKKN